MANAGSEITPTGRELARPGREEQTLAEVAAELEQLRRLVLRSARAAGVLAQAGDRRGELDEVLRRASEGCRGFGEFGHNAARALEDFYRPRAGGDAATQPELPASPSGGRATGLTWRHVAGILIAAGVGVAGAVFHADQLYPIATLILGGVIGHASTPGRPGAQ